MNDDHAAVWEAENAGLAETAWEAWAKDTETLFGRSLDGDQSEDGYSLDGFYAFWEAGHSPERAVALASVAIATNNHNGPNESVLSARQRREIDTALRHMGRAMKAFARAGLPEPSDHAYSWLFGLHRGERRLGEASDTVIDALEEMAIQVQGHGK